MDNSLSSKETDIPLSVPLFVPLFYMLVFLLHIQLPV